MLGLATAIIGAMFVLIGLNAALRPSGDESGRPPSPVTGPGYGERRPSARTRLIVAVMWLTLGVLFIVAAFTNQVP
ncbi:MAG: hypothetical protein ACYDD4_02425 [Acidimicrobiales bacterium]